MKEVRKLDIEEEIKAKIEKDARIKKELNKLKKIFKDLSRDTKDTVSSLINNAAFMAVTLEDLQVQINLDGGISKYQNGENQWGTKKSPEVEIYNSMIKNHMSIIKQLTDLLPKSNPNGAGDDFEDFIKSK